MALPAIILGAGIIAALKFIWKLVRDVLGPFLLVFLQKMMLIGLTTLLLPLVLFQVFLKCKEYIMGKVLEYLSTLELFDQATFIELTGIGAYFADRLNIIQIVTIIMSATVVAFTLSMIRAR